LLSVSSDDVAAMLLANDQCGVVIKNIVQWPNGPVLLKHFGQKN